MNRHLKIAFIVAPFLAIGGYAVMDQYDYYQKKKLAKALYTLKAEGACVLSSGACVLKNESLTVSLSSAAAETNGDVPMYLESSVALAGGKLGFGDEGAEIPQRSLQQLQDDQHWRVGLPQAAIGEASAVGLRMVLMSGGRVYIAEVEAAIR
jgi:hypothetical protein